MNKNKTVKNNLNALILENNTNIKDLAEYVKVSPSSIYNWLQGIRLPKYDFQKKICEYFNLPDYYLMMEHDNPSTNTLHLKDATIVDLSVNCHIEPSFFTELQCVKDSYGNVLLCKNEEAATTFTEFANVFKGSYLNEENKQHLLSYAKFLLEQQKKGA